jgi:Ca2+-binding RTX toxin-like protein
MRRMAILLGVVATMVVLIGGVALAKSISCPNRDNGRCVGTAKSETLTGTNRADTMKARGGADTVNARGGADRASGGGGGDILDGGAGNDNLNGGANLDTELEALVGGVGDDTLVESAGPDRHVFGAGWGEDRITGDGDPTPGINNDDVCFNCGPSPASAGLTIDLAAGRAFETAVGPTGPNSVTWAPEVIEFAVGGTGPDAITGSDRSNVVNGATGADSINVAGDGGGDFINCGGDLATDMVTRDAGDTIQGNSCDGDTIVTVP